MAIYVIPVVALGVYYTYCYDMFCTVEFYYGATRYVMVASVVGALVNVILNAVFIPVFGFIAAAYTTLFSYMIFMLMHYVFMHRVMKEQSIEEEIYDIRFTFLFSVVLSAVTFGCILTYQNDWLRYAVIGVVVIALIASKDLLMSLANTMRKR